MIRAAYQPQGTSDAVQSKRALIVHDTLTFLLLTFVAVALFGVTLFLFRSFNGHRADLAKGWADEGRTELRQGKAAQAVESLRAALSYAPDDYDSQLLLAQALADAGDTEQAANYFLNLKAARPGDGFINLELARLARRRGDREEAITSYRASIFGDWRGDGAIRRRDVRLELIDYLIAQHNDAAARAELLIAAGNAPNDLHLNLLFADKLRAAGDDADAFNFYQKAILDDPHSVAASEAAGRLAYQQGEYIKAHTLLERAIAAKAGKQASEELVALSRNADRMAELSLSRELPAQERAKHLLADAKIAQARLNGCPVAPGGAAQAAAPTQELQTRWRAAREGSRRNALVQNAAGQDSLTELIFDTERTTAQLCGAPAGDDALLLTLASREGDKP